MTVVIGIDPSAKKIALVAHHIVTNTSLVRAYPLYGTREKQTPESIYRAMECMIDFLDDVEAMSSPLEPRFAYVENPLVGRGGVTTTTKQAFVGGVVRACLVKYLFTVYGVNVSTWKKDVCGNGAAKKPDVARVVKTQWPKVDSLLGGDGDLIDAAAISLYGQEQVRKARVLGVDAQLAASTVQGRRPRKVVRAPRLRSGV